MLAHKPLPEDWRVEFVRTQGLNDDRWEVWDGDELIGVSDDREVAIQDAMRWVDDEPEVISCDQRTDAA